MRRVGGNGGDAHAMETINAAATAIASVENRGAQPSARKRRWGSCLGIYWCFGLSKNKRIGHAVLAPENNASGTEAPPNDHPSQPPSLALPFVAPPSSPASFLPSEPPSATQSPPGLLSLSVSANMYSPSGPHSIFAIGPYAHEPQLVSPPVFSTFTTEPSTAPYTPPPESVHLTTPSSPEVPFARLLEPNLQNGESVQRYPFFQYEFQSYQLQPGSPVSHLISPSSGISGSGTSSPFPDRDLTAAHPFFLEFKTGNPPTLLDLDKIVIRECESCQGSGAVTPDAAWPSTCNASIFNRQNSDVAPLPNTLLNDEPADNRRVSFEITEEEVIRCVEKKQGTLTESSLELTGNAEHTEESKTTEMVDDDASCSPAGDNIPAEEHTDHGKEPRHHKHRTITLGSTREFNFEKVDDVNSDNPSMESSEWWVNEKVRKEDGSPCKNWSFFPMMETGVS
ncbi:uncharacterized protein LOC127243159 [Andrographis paniculata]|uniref:uncharacterized protein LOC127243159 n=1 Tax=Andrographis paniculata TaxID=175694 RepID=UPI0021E85AD3|nr:uncharacterized protein LOC127243159 [Andrographis paniculata]